MDTNVQRQVFLLSAVIALGVAWVGVWGAWIEHPAPALTRNAIGLAEWGPYLDEVRSGAISHAPTLLRISVSLLITALAVAAARVRQWPLRWAIRVIALTPALWMLPPYPEILSPFAFGYGARLAAVGAAFVGVASALLWDGTNIRVQLVVTGVCAAVSAVLALLSFGMMSGPFAVHYATPLSLGWGLFVTLLALLIASGLAAFGAMRDVKQGA